MTKNPRQKRKRFNRTLGSISSLRTDRFVLQRKNVTSEYYDTSDPFIDDSELALDERQFFAQTKQQGFYVSSGEVALMKDKYAPGFPSLISFFGPDLPFFATEPPKNRNPRKSLSLLGFIPLSPRRRRTKSSKVHETHPSPSTETRNG
jgi:hypothetical protein